MKLLLALCLTLSLSQAYAAIYEVPMSVELKEFARFELPDFIQENSDGKISIEYNLPVILTGDVQKIRLEGVVVSQNSEVVLVGDKAVANCFKTKYSTFSCTVRYFDLEINEAKAKEAILKISKTRVERLGRIAVMRAFSSDPVGIITY